MACRKNSPGNPCCYQNPCSCDGTPENFANLHFESSGGLHDVSFDSPLWSRKTANTSIMDSFWPNPISTASACDPKIKHDLVSARNFVNLVDSNTCCLAAYAWPTTRCRSEGKVHNSYQSERGVYTIKEEWHYMDFPTGCDTGWLDRGTTTTDVDIDWAYSTLAFREVYGVTLRACYISMYGYIPKLRLTATVEYRDWFLGKLLRGNGTPASFLYAFSGSPSYYRRNSFFFCELQAAESSSSGTGCRPRTSRLSVLSKDSIVECDTCPPPTSTTHEGVNVLCNGIERISREIILDPDCSIIGTHTFLSPIAPQGKYVMSSAGCCGTTIIFNECNFVPSWLCAPPPSGSNLPTYQWPTAGVATGTYSSYGDINFDLRRVTTTYTSAITVEDSSSGDGVLLPDTQPECKAKRWKMLDYWSEPWSITIS